MAFLHDLLLGASLKTWIMVYIPIASIVYWAVWIIYARTLHPLAKVPGPFWPSVSRTWIMFRMYAGNMEKYQRLYHEKYGPIVRIAPNEVAIADPQAIPKIYPLENPNQKTDWYTAWRPRAFDSRTDLFTESDEQVHTSYRRIVGSTYGLTSVLKNEQAIDEVLLLFLKRIGELADSRTAFDFGAWLRMFGMDMFNNAERWCVVNTALSIRRPWYLHLR